jgi:hypothetical protein
MPRSNPALLTNVGAAQSLGSNQWKKTDGFLHSFEACADTGLTSATVDIYVSDSSHGVGVKIGSLTLSAAQTSDGLSLPKEDQGWFFVRAEVSAVAGGAVKSCTACVGAEV